MTATAKTVKAATKAAAGVKGRSATSAHPKKAAKTALAASRVSQRSAILSKKKAAAAATNVPASPADDGETAPELLRGKEGESRLDSTLEISLAVSPPPPPSPSLPPSSSSPSPPSPSSPLSYHNPCDCETPCTEKDYHDETWEDGVRLNTLEPPWARVFPHYRALSRCRFCKEPLPDEDDDTGGDSGDDSNGECQDCKELSVLCLVKKYAPRWRYPTN
jgi:hypothetical protein